MAIAVDNDGPALATMPNAAESGGRVEGGLSNLLARLRLSYGVGAELSIENRDVSGVRATLFIADQLPQNDDKK